MIRCDTAIVGGGFSGCAVAAQLARITGPFSLVLFEPGPLGRGAAYGTRHREHLLNTRAAAMSIFADDRDHFVRWLGGRAAPSDFVSRQSYGDYVADVARLAFDRDGFDVVAAKVVSMHRSAGGFVLETEDGKKYESRTAVIATGNALPGDAALPRGVPAHPRYIADPWRFDYRSVAGDVLIVGSGLTALDVLGALESSGHSGAVYVVSRHAQFPQTHAEITEAYGVVPALDASNARTLLRSLRSHLREAAARGYDWRAVVDALRPESESLWRRLSTEERLRFDRHLRRRWERHRHRAPGAVDAVRQRYADKGRLFPYSGRITEYAAGEVTVALRDGAEVTLRPDWIVNCTGPAPSRTIAPPPLGLDLRVHADLHAVDDQGRALPGLWFVGPPLRAVRFEATAVPELRLMAQAVARGIVKSFEEELTQVV
ncbi:MAG TPA: FAD/NAD(P)-binding protein [Candidatus Baltobacteraceae bacterium]|jgi:uncharacterized NAD(P)/FAD-binding protein YdhS